MLAIKKTLALTLFFFACDTLAQNYPQKTNTQAVQSNPTPPKNSRREIKPIPVKIETTSSKMLPRLISVIAPLAGRKQADIYAKATGRISQLGPSEGTKIRAGDTLFKIDRSDPGENFLSAPVISPIDGWIGRWIVQNIGEQVTPNDPVVTVIDDEYLRSTIYLSTSDWVEIDDQAKITFRIQESKRSGQLVSIARIADSATGLGSILVEVANSDHTWRVGMIAKIDIELDIRPRMLISSAAINITDQGSYVYVVKADRASRIAVNYRLVDNDSLEIISGLEEGAQVVVAGGNLLSDGASVSVVSNVPGGEH